MCIYAHTYEGGREAENERQCFRLGWACTWELGTQSQTFMAAEAYLHGPSPWPHTTCFSRKLGSAAREPIQVLQHGTEACSLASYPHVWSWMHKNISLCCTVSGVCYEWRCSTEQVCTRAYVCVESPHGAGGWVMERNAPGWIHI